MSTVRLTSLSLVLLFDFLASGRALASESHQRFAWIAGPAPGKVLAPIEAVSAVLFRATADDLLAADESPKELSSDSKSQSMESKPGNEEKAGSASPPSPPQVENKSRPAALPLPPTQPAASATANPSSSKSPQRKPIVRSPSILQMLDGHELELLAAAAIALSFFIIGWICGGNYYLRRDRRRRTKLRF